MSHTKLLATLPDPELMKKRLRTFTMLDAIVAPDLRSFEWHPRWAPGEQVGAFKNGEGDSFHVWFTRAGTVLLGFDHESPMSAFRKKPPAPWPGLFQGMPRALAPAATEPAFGGGEEITFFFWARGSLGAWKMGAVKPPRGKDPDGAARLLGCFGKFRTWAEDYYGVSLHPEAMQRLWWEREPLDRPTVAALNPDADLAAVRREARNTGWPMATGAGARKPTPPTADFGEAEFTVRCGTDRVSLLVHGKPVVTARADVYEELFDLVKGRLTELRVARPSPPRRRR